MINLMFTICVEHLQHTRRTKNRDAIFPESENDINRHGGEGGGVCSPRVFCPSKIPSFLARWRVRGPAGTGSVGDSDSGEGDGSYGRDADASEQASDASDRS